jgi:predicted Zn-dependent protease
MAKKILQSKITLLLFTLTFIFNTFVLMPVTHASLRNILIGGVVEYFYLRESLLYAHNKQSNEIMSGYKKEYGENSDERATEVLDSVMHRLLKSIDPDEKIKPKFSWFVNNQTTFNAFCGLGHNVSVNIGLFHYLNYNEDEIAFVLAHELVHGMKLHSLSSLPKLVSFNVVQALYLEKNPGTISYITSYIINRNLVATYATLPQEKEADANSFSYAVDAGFNPGAGAAIWSRVTAKSGDNGHNSFENVINPNDHPTNKQRVEYFAKRLEEYSNNKVKVSKGTVYINGKAWVTPAAAGDLLAEERAYFVAGNLATLLRTAPSGYQAELIDGVIRLNGKTIMTPTDNDQNADELIAALHNLVNS